jgi:hypothetical protein
LKPALLALDGTGSRKDTEALSFSFYLYTTYISFENYCPSPDGSGNPFAFCSQKAKDWNGQREIAPD